MESGKTVKKGTDITFTATPVSDYELDYLRINGELKSGTNVTAKADKDIMATAKFKKPSDPATVFYTVTFDAQGGSEVASVTVEGGQKIEKPANPQKPSSTFGGWYKESTYTTPWNFASDTVTANITLYAKWQTTSSTSITIRFEASKIRCWKEGKPVNNSDTVYENDRLSFEATLPEGTTVNKWTVNGMERALETYPWFGYTVQAADVKDGSITIAYREKPAQQVPIHFEASKMRCLKEGDPVNGGDKVYENDQLYFEATLPEGTTVDKWTVNSVERDQETRPQFNYIVQAADVKDGSITIAYKEKPAQQVTIHFDPSKMTCKKNGSTVNNGNKVYENDQLHFKATPPEGKTVDKWTVNGVERDYEIRPEFWYLVQAADMKDGSINIDYTVK